MELAARPCFAAAAALAAASVVAGTPVVAPSLPQIHVPAIQFIGDSSFFQPILDPAAGFEQTLLEGALTFDKVLTGNEGTLAGQAFSGLSGFDAIEHETDFIPNAMTSLFNANGLLDPTDFNSLVVPQLNVDPSAINGSAIGSSAANPASAVDQTGFLSADVANAMTAVASDFSALGTALATLNTDLATASTDFATNFITQTEAIATALESFNAAGFASALQNLADFAAFQTVVATDLPAVAQALLAFGDIFAAGEILTAASMAGF